MDARDVLSRYSIGPLKELSVWGGTAGRTVRVFTEGAIYLLRRRGVRTSGDERIRFDHVLRRLLVEHGIPTALPLRTVSDSGWIATPEGAYELYPFVQGTEHARGSLREIRSAARTLAAFHGVATELRSRWDPPRFEQFSLASPGTPASTRIDDPACMRAAIERLAPGLSAKERRVASGMIQLVESIGERYGGSVYGELDRHVVHGDFHPANLLFDGRGDVAGLFDFDWAGYAPRVRDIADGIHFFAGVPGLAGSDIWALTSAHRIDQDLAAAFLREYHAASPLAEAELRAVPLAWLARWVAIHIEGVAKVEPSLKGRFLTRDVLESAHQISGFDAAALLRSG